MNQKSLIILLAAGAAGYYFYDKSKGENPSSQPAGNSGSGTTYAPSGSASTVKPKPNVGVAVNTGISVAQTGLNILQQGLTLFNKPKPRFLPLPLPGQEETRHSQ